MLKAQRADSTQSPVSLFCRTHKYNQSSNNIRYISNRYIRPQQNQHSLNHSFKKGRRITEAMKLLQSQDTKDEQEEKVTEEEMSKLVVSPGHQNHSLRELELNKAESSSPPFLNLVLQSPNAGGNDEEEASLIYNSLC